MIASTNAPVPLTSTSPPRPGDNALVSRLRARDRAAWTAGPEKLLADREMMQHLEGILARLPERLRLVLTLRDIEGLEVEEVCNMLGVTETHLRVLLRRARTRVRAELEPLMTGAA